MDYKTWRNDTKRKWKPRSSDLKAVDMAVKNYFTKQNPVTLYLLYTALEKWKQAKREDWKKSIRNSTGTVEELDNLINLRRGNIKIIPHGNKRFEVELSVYGGKRSLRVDYRDVNNPTNQEIVNINALVPDIYRRAIEATNHAYARGRGYRNANELLENIKNSLPYTRLKDWLKIQRKFIQSTRTSMWTEDCFDFIYGNARKTWRLDNHRDTKEIMKRVLGKDHATFQRKMVANPLTDDMALMFRESLISVISAMNLEKVYVKISRMGAVGSSSKSYGNWRSYHDVWDTTRQEIAYERSRMEKHLISDVARTRPIQLNINYLNVNMEKGGYENVYGDQMTYVDHLTKTFLHEASHMWVASEDHYYFRPNAGRLSAHAALGLKTGVQKKDILAPQNVETERCVLNADTIGWFLYWWGKA